MESLSVLTAAESPLDLPPGVLFGGCVPLVVQMLAAAKTHFQLHAPVLQVNLEGNERVALTAHQPGQLADLRFVQEQLLGPQRIGVEEIAVVIGTDVLAFVEYFAVAQFALAFVVFELSL